MWIKSLLIQQLRNAHVTNYNPVTAAGAPGLYSDALVPGSARPVPDCLQAAFAPALIACQSGLTGVWLPDHSPINSLARRPHIKNDPISRHRCVLTGTTCWSEAGSASRFSISAPFSTLPRALKTARGENAVVCFPLSYLSWC